MSSFPTIGDVGRGLARLESDLTSGAWHRHNRHLLDDTAIDLGYRLVVAA